MTSGAPVNTYAATAAQLVAAASVSEEEAIFKQAFDCVRQRPEHAKLAKTLMTQFETARNPKEFLQTFDQCRDRNSLWTLSRGNSKTRRVGRFADRFLAFKQLGDSLVMPNQTIAAPVWGACCACLIVTQTIVQTDEKLNTILKRIQNCLNLYTKLHVSGRKLNDQLRSRLVDFNEVVVSFCLTIGKLLTQGKLESWLGAATKSIDSGIQTLSIQLKDAVDAINESIQFEMRHDVKDIKTAQAFPPAMAQTQRQPFDHGRTEFLRVPDMLTINFTGRDQELTAIGQCFNRPNVPGCAKCVLFGIGGVGKSQTALRYATDHSFRNTNAAYSYILFVRAQNPSTLLAEICKLGEELQLYDSTIGDMAEQTVVTRMKRWLQQHHNWLFIFDNVCDSNDVLQYLPSDGDGHVLFTTRSETIATRLVGTSQVIEIKPMDADTDGAAFVLRISKSQTVDPQSRRTAAIAISRFAHGIPLAIEQLVNLSELSGFSLEQALHNVKNKSEILMRQNFCSSHEQNLSIGAIIVETLQQLQKSHPMAASLFQMLVYLNTSSIPMALLYGAGQKLQQHFDRAHTYVSGQIRTPGDTERLNKLANEESAPFCLWDYDPFTLELVRKIFRRGQYHPRATKTDLPRVDSDSDIELRDFWTQEGRILQTALSNSINVDAALNILDKVGLARSIRAYDAIWIHDLFAELTVSLLKMESSSNNKLFAHIAATTVYLNFPVPVFSPIPKVSLACLPHAISTHNHVNRAGILNDTTIGAELSHLIASTIKTTLGSFEHGNKDYSNITSIIHYYRHAFLGYQQAWKRLQRLPNMNWQRIILSTFADYVREDIAARYLVSRHQWDYERFGKSAPWRCIQSMGKLRLLLLEDNQLDEALDLAQKTADFNEKIFGPRQEDTLGSLGVLVHIYTMKQDYINAYATACKRARFFMGMRDQNGASKQARTSAKDHIGLRDTEEGGQIAKDCGDCAINIAGKESEVLIWYEIYLAARSHIYGDTSQYCYGAFKRMGHIHELLNNLSASLFWRAQALSTTLENKDLHRLLMKDYTEWDNSLLQDKYADEAVVDFRRLRGLAGVLEPELEQFVEYTEQKAKEWEELRPVVQIRNESPPLGDAEDNNASGGA